MNSHTTPIPIPPVHPPAEIREPETASGKSLLQLWGGGGQLQPTWALNRTNNCPTRFNQVHTRTHEHKLLLLIMNKERGKDRQKELLPAATG